MKYLTPYPLVLVAAAVIGCGGWSALVEDRDGDGVVDALDYSPDDQTRCQDADADGCDDCSVAGAREPANDGWDPDGDGDCDLPLDFDCMNGAGSGSDPWRTQACVTLALANADRAHFAAESGNAAPLRWNEDIWAVAFGHSTDMCSRGYFAHVNPEGHNPSARASLAGLNYGLSENISANLDPQASAYGLMLEPTCEAHRGNILDRRAIEVGIGYVECDNPANTPWGRHHHVTQNFRLDFTRPPSAFCQDPATACEIPPDPPTTAVCPQNLIDIGFCPPPDSSLLTEFGCPVD